MEKDENKDIKPNIEQQHSGIGHNVGGNLEITNNFNITQEQTHKPFPKRLNAIGYAMPERTLGRDGDVERLHQLLQREGAAVVMNGMGGIGKTTTAIYYAQRHEADYAHIIWLKSGGNVWDTLLFDGELLRALDIEQGINGLLQAKQHEQATALLKDALKTLPPRLLWLADNPSVRVQEELMQLKNDFSNGVFLLTSREKPLSFTIYALDYLDMESARLLFKQNCGQDAFTPEEEGILGELLEKTLGHAYLVMLLGRTYKNKRGLSLDELHKDFVEKGIYMRYRAKIAAENLPTDKKDAQNKAYINEVLEYVFDLSELDALPSAQQLLRHLALLPSEGLGYKQLEQLLHGPLGDGFALEEALNALVEKGWLQEAPGKRDVYHCHNMLQAVVRHKLPLNDMEMEALLDSMDSILGNNNKNEWWENAIWLPYCDSLLRYYTSETGLLGRVNNYIGLLYYHQGKYEEALSFYHQALAIKEKVFGKMHPDTAIIYNNIGSVYLDQSKYEQALAFYKQSLSILKNKLGKMHPDTANSYVNIGMVYSQQGQYEKALAFYQKGLAIQEKVLNKIHPDIARSYNNMGFVYHSLGQHDKALALYQQALDIQEQILGKMHPHTASSYNNIGLVYQHQGQYDKTLDYFRQALDIREKVLGKMHLSTVISYNNLGSAYNKIEKYDKALALYQQALDIQEQILGKMHPITANLYNNIGNVHYHQSQYDKALAFFQEALEIQKNILGEMHPDTAKSYNNIGIVYDNLGQYAQALGYYQKTLDILKVTLPFEHRNILIGLNNYIDVLNKWGNERPEEDISGYEDYVFSNFEAYFKK